MKGNPYCRFMIVAWYIRGLYITIPVGDKINYSMYHFSFVLQKLEGFPQG